MNHSLRLLTLMGLALVGLAASPNARAEVITYTDPTAFQAALAPGSYLNTFSSLAANTQYSSPQRFSSGGFSYNVVGDPGGGLFSGQPGEPWIGNEKRGPTEVDITGGTVTAIGLNVFTTNDLNAPDGGPITVTVNGVGLFTFASTSTSTFIGFTDTVPITSLVVSSSRSTEFTALTNLTVGMVTPSAVPEPSSLVLVGLGSIGALVSLRKGRGHKVSPRFIHEDDGRFPTSTGLIRSGPRDVET
jgi:hypothetical protein